jgi:L-seryl-tRNA(Ser) seleniumtransferase
VSVSFHLTADELRPRTARLADVLGRDVVGVEGRVGGGGAPGFALPGWAVEVPVATIERLRRPPAGVPVVLARVEGGRGLVDLRCVPAERDDDVREALAVALADVDASQ